MGSMAIAFVRRTFLVTTSSDTIEKFAHVPASGPEQVTNHYPEFIFLS